MNGARSKIASAGFSLVELLAASVLAAIGLLAIMTAMQCSRDTAFRSDNLSFAQDIAQSKIEQIRSLKTSSISTVVGTTTDSSLPKGNSISVALAPYPSAVDTALQKATVTVTYPEVKGTRKICYETLVYKP